MQSEHSSPVRHTLDALAVQSVRNVFILVALGKSHMLAASCMRNVVE